jgi:hypothetical protein
MDFLPCNPHHLPTCAHRLNSTSVRLCNNALGNLTGLDKAMYHLLDNPNELVWLDVSCNQLTSIEDIVLRYPKLQVNTEACPHHA